MDLLNIISVLHRILWHIMPTFGKNLGYQDVGTLEYRDGVLRPSGKYVGVPGCK